MAKQIDSTNIGGLLEDLLTRIKNAFWRKGETSQLSIDNTPTNNSDNLVKSGGVHSAIQNHADTTIPDTGYTSSEMHLPEVTSADNGKTLRVVDGEWALVEETNVYSGSGAPSQSLGNNGDIYLETS